MPLALTHTHCDTHRRSFRSGSRLSHPLTETLKRIASAPGADVENRVDRPRDTDSDFRSNRKTWRLLPVRVFREVLSDRFSWQHRSELQRSFLVTTSYSASLVPFAERECSPASSCERYVLSSGRKRRSAQWLCRYTAVATSLIDLRLRIVPQWHVLMIRYSVTTQTAWHAERSAWDSAPKHDVLRG